MTFWDASAVVALVIGQESAEQLREVLAQDPDLSVWWAARVEITSALCRLRRDQTISDLNYREAAKGVQELLARCHEVEPVEAVRSRASALLPVYTLRAADALQLAAALVWADHRPFDVAFVCLDRRLRAAAAAEGFLIAPEM